MTDAPQPAGADLRIGITDDFDGDVSGNIHAEATGLTTFSFGGNESDGGMAWLGNVAAPGAKSTGDVTLITGQAGGKLS